MVKVRRNVSVDVTYQTLYGQTVEWKGIEQSLSELLQHEIDHLNGVLAVDLALKSESDSIISRELYERNRATFDSQVDYVIVPTL